MNTKKKTGQSRPALLGDNPLIPPVDHGEDMLTPAGTNDFEIGRHNSLTELAEETVFEEESLYSPDSLQDYDMLLEPENENSMAMEKDSWFADNMFAADNGSVTDNDSVAEGEALADLPVEPTFYDLTKEDEVDLDIDESEQSQSDSLLFNGLDDAFTINNNTSKDTVFDDFETLLDDERLAESEFESELTAVNSLEQYPHKEESDDDSLLSDGQLYGFKGDDSGGQSVRDYELEADLLESDQTAEDETKENLEETEQERTDDDSIIFSEQLHGFEGDDSAAEAPALDSFTALPSDDCPASDELEDLLDDFFTRDDNTSSGLDKFADQLDDDRSGENGFTAEPTNDILEPDLTTADETTEDHEETETENAVFADLLEPDQTVEDETKENLEAAEQERTDDDNILFAEQLHGFEGDNSATEDPALDIFAALPGTASDELEDVLDDFFTRDDNTSSGLDKFADQLDDNSSAESGFTTEPTSDIFEPDLTKVEESTEDHEETETEYAVFLADLLEPDQTAEDEIKENLEAAEQERTDDDSIIFGQQLHGFEGDNSATEDPALDIFAALPSTASDELEDVLDDFFTRDDNRSGESGFTAEPTSDISEPDLTKVEESTEDHEETEREYAVSADSAVDQTIIVPNTNEEVVSDEVTEQMVTDQFSKKMMPDRFVDLSPVAAIAKPGTSIKQDIRELVTRDRHCLVNSGKRLVIVLAVLVVLGGAWYSYNNMGDGSHTLQQQADDRQQQVSRNNLDDHSELVVTRLDQPEPKMPESSDSGKDPVNEPKQKISKQLENNSGELDRRLSAEEQKLRGYGNSGQAAQVSNQLKLPAQMQPIETDQPGVAEKIALQAGQLETDIGQLENQVSQLQQEQSTVRNTISSAEQKIVANTASPTTIEVETGLEQEQKKQPATVSESITAKVVSGPAEQRTSASPPPNITEAKETISFSPDKPIMPEAGTAKQTGWAVNLSSFRKRSSAEKERKRLNGLGLETVTSKALVNGTFWFRVQIEGFSSSRAAWEYIKLHLDHTKFKDAWVSKKPK